MAKDKLKEYVRLKQDLLTEKQHLETRLKEINAALNGVEDQPTAAPAKTRTKSTALKTTPKFRRVKNNMSLREAIDKVLTKPMTKREIHDAVKKVGYKFGGADPLNSLGSFLYSKRNKLKLADGMFSK